MHSPLDPKHEERRLAFLHGLGLFDSLPQAAFDEVAALAQQVCQAPIALIGFVDSHHQWFRAQRGLEIDSLARHQSFCAHAIQAPDGVFEVADAHLDPRFADTPLVAGPPSVRFYAGAPIVVDGDIALGAISVMDLQPRRLSAEQADTLRRLASLVGHLIAQAHAKAQSSRQANEELLAMVTAGLDMLAFIDCDQTYRHVNQTFLDYNGCRREDVIQKTVAEHIGAEPYETMVRHHLERALSGQRVLYDRKAFFKGRGLRHIEVAMLPMRDSTGAICGIVMRAHDIEDLKQKEERLGLVVRQMEQKTLEQQRFIQIISHDLREPINSINNFSQLLDELYRPLLPDDGQRYLDFVRSGVLRMRDLLDDLLHYVHLDNHQPKSMPVDLNGLMAAVIADLDSAIKRRNAIVEVGPMPTVQADPTLMRLALQNLVANALKFVAEGVQPHVCVSASFTDGEHAIHVQDNGIGIAPEHHQAIFGVFTRLHSRRQFDGSGLGLSICRRIVDLHQGRLLLTSNPGQGSRFSIHLPEPAFARRSIE